MIVHGNHLNHIGTTMNFAGSSAPDGWLMCNGDAISRTTYSDLFSVIGTLYGSGDGSTTFNLPNTEYRIPSYRGTLGSCSGSCIQSTGGSIGSVSPGACTWYTAPDNPSHSHAPDEGSLTWVHNTCHNATYGSYAARYHGNRVHTCWFSSSGSNHTHYYSASNSNSSFSGSNINVEQKYISFLTIIKYK